MGDVPILRPPRRKRQRPSQDERLELLRGLGKGFRPKSEGGLVVASEAEVPRAARQFRSRSSDPSC